MRLSKFPRLVAVMLVLAMALLFVVLPVLAIANSPPAAALSSWPFVVFMISITGFATVTALAVKGARTNAKISCNGPGVIGAHNLNAITVKLRHFVGVLWNILRTAGVGRYLTPRGPTVSQAWPTGGGNLEMGGGNLTRGPAVNQLRSAPA